MEEKSEHSVLLTKIPIHNRLKPEIKKIPRIRNKVNNLIDLECINTDSSQSNEEIVHLKEPQEKLTLIERAVGYFNAENDIEAQNSTLNLTINDGPPFICKICKDWFYMGSKLKLHYILNHTILHCDICSILFESESDRNIHLSKYHSPIFCEICQKYFENLETLMSHYEVDHDSTTCQFCGILLQPRSMANTHIIRKHSVFPKFLETKQNIISNVDMSAATFFCALCNKNREIEIFFGHMNSHHKLNINSLLNLMSKMNGVKVSVTGTKQDEIEGDRDEDKIYKNSCSVCLFRFTKKIPQQCHLIYCQSKIQCKYCNKNFANSTYYERHIEKSHSKFLCKQGCDKLAYNSEENLFKHYLKFHENVSCRYCDAFIPFQNFDDHLEKIHKYKAEIMKNFTDTLFEVTERENKHIVICCLCDENISLLAEKIRDIFQHYSTIHSVDFTKILQLIGPKPVLEDYDSFYREINESIKTENDDKNNSDRFVPKIKIKVEDFEDYEDKNEQNDESDEEIPKLVKKFSDFSHLQTEIESDFDNDETEILINSDSELEDENSEFICEFCDTKLGKLIDLLKHIEDIHKIRTKYNKMNCNYCSDINLKYKTHANHLLSHHNNANFDFAKEMFNCGCENVQVVHSLARNHVLAVHKNDLIKYNVQELGLKCKFCKHKLWEREELNEHEVREHFKDNHTEFQKCFKCSSIFSSQKALATHVESSHSEEPTYNNIIYKCLICTFAFPTLPILREHFREKHPNTRMYRCPVEHCSKVCKKKKYMISHLTRPHESEKEQEAFCDVCGRKFKSFKAASIHKLMKHERDRAGFQCRICNERFGTSEQRKLHYTTAHPGQLAYNCVECGKGFISKSGLYGHKKTHQENNNIVCPYCSKEFTRRDSYNEHLLIHIGPRHQCPHCPKSFTQRSNLTRHVRIHTGAKPYQCCYCEKRFSDRGACRSHERVHTKEEHCECPYCGKKFTKKQKLKYHLRYHTGEGLLDCEICGKQFSNTYSLNEHRRIHNSDTLLMCSCGRGFATEKYLNRHMQNIHKQAAVKYICPVCFKSLYTKAAYNSHIMTHATVKHVKCLLCNKEYNTKKTVKRHLQEEHNLRGSPEILKHIYQLTPEEAGLNLPPASEMAIKIVNEDNMLNEDKLSQPTNSIPNTSPPVMPISEILIKEEPISDYSDSEDDLPLKKRKGKQIVKKSK